jgi:hypothetical protein
LAAVAASEGDVARRLLNLWFCAPMTTAMERRMMQSGSRVRPALKQPSLADVVGGLVLLAIAALLVAVAVVTAAS